MRPLGFGPDARRVTCLGLGGFHIGWTSEKLAAATIEAALEEGVRFFDTAESYGPHTSEERYGRYLTPDFRDLIFLMTKSTAKDGATATKHIDDSLRRLKTDTIDLWQIHSIMSPDDVDERLDAGVLDAALNAKAQGKIKNIGFTGHASPYAHLRMLERTSDMKDVFLAALLPISPVDAASRHSFIKEVIPALQERRVACLAMKTLADGRFFASKQVLNKQGESEEVWRAEHPVVPTDLSIQDCVHFALSLPVAVAITGAENPEFIREKATFARRFFQFSPEERNALTAKVAAYAVEGQVEYYKQKDLRG